MSTTPQRRQHASPEAAHSDYYKRRRRAEDGRGPRHVRAGNLTELISCFGIVPILPRSTPCSRGCASLGNYIAEAERQGHSKTCART